MSRNLHHLQVQASSHAPLCPLCRNPFEACLALSVNTELRDALQRAAVAAARAAVEKGSVHGETAFSALH
jgi:hypothetical protein